MAEERSAGVLVVDDRPDLRALLQSALRHYGFDVLLAQNASAAAELYRFHGSRIAIVLLGVTPKSDPLHALRALQKVNPQVICCALIDALPTATEGDLVASGVVRVIPTPFEPAALAKLLWGLVGAGDRRHGRRSPRQTTRVAVTPGLTPSHVVESWVGDESPGGLRLTLPEKLGEVGAILSIRPADAAADEPWVPVQVRHVHAEDDGWAVGCSYLFPAAKKD